MLRPNERVLTIAEEISHYLEGHPDAADTLEGVVNWWLARQRFEYAFRTVEKALNHLVAEGKLEKHVTVDGRTVYSSLRVQTTTH